MTAKFLRAKNRKTRLLQNWLTNNWPKTQKSKRRISREVAGAAVGRRGDTGLTEKILGAKNRKTRLSPTADKKSKSQTPDVAKNFIATRATT